MNKTSAVTTSQKVNAELLKLDGNLLINLFVIDFSSLVFSPLSAPFFGNTVFRFHNNIKYMPNNIVWNNQTYIAAPIQAEGFEQNSKGAISSPKLSLSVPDSQVNLLKLFKQQLAALDHDLVGAKVTRIRTFAKFLDAVNFTDETAPVGLDPDPNAELCKDIFYINQKTYEDKNVLQFDLTSIFDLSGLQLPQRIVSANRCLFAYRGEGCLYEKNDRRNTTIHGSTSTLPENAPPVATVNDELIYGEVLRNNESYVDKGEFSLLEDYYPGDSVYIEKNGIKYYFVAVAASSRNNSTHSDRTPPNSKYWVADECSRTQRGCALRPHNRSDGALPFGGFPGVDRII